MFVLFSLVLSFFAGGGGGGGVLGLFLGEETLMSGSHFYFFERRFVVRATEAKRPTILALFHCELRLLDELAYDR